MIAERPASEVARTAGEQPCLDALTNDHWVSRGYQNNFATTDKRVAVLDVRLRRIVETDRPTKRNFAEVGFITFVADGAPVNDFERAFAKVERTVLNQVRTVSATNRGPDLHGAVANLFAIHLVRSPSYKAFNGRVKTSFRANGVAAVVNNERLPAMFEAQFGRAPNDGELDRIALEQFDRLIADPYSLADSMVHHHDQIADKLSRFYMQVIEIAPGLPGFVLGDTPVVHADVATGRYGFRDSLAFGDASMIVGPLARMTAACFAARPLAPVTITTHKALDALNALFVRAAAAEVACHPDDARRLQQVASRLDVLPPDLFLRRPRRLLK